MAKKVILDRSETMSSALSSYISDAFALFLKRIYMRWVYAQPAEENDKSGCLLPNGIFVELHDSGYDERCAILDSIHDIYTDIIQDRFVPIISIDCMIVLECYIHWKTVGTQQFLRKNVDFISTARWIRPDYSPTQDVPQKNYGHLEEIADPRDISIIQNWHYLAAINDVFSYHNHTFSLSDIELRLDCGRVSYSHQLDEDETLALPMKSGVWASLAKNVNLDDPAIRQISLDAMYNLLLLEREILRLMEEENKDYPIDWWDESQYQDSSFLTSPQQQDLPTQTPSNPYPQALIDALKNRGIKGNPSKNIPSASLRFQYYVQQSQQQGLISLSGNQWQWHRTKKALGAWAEHILKATGLMSHTPKATHGQNFPTWKLIEEMFNVKGLNNEANRANDTPPADINDINKIFAITPSIDDLDGLKDW